MCMNKSTMSSEFMSGSLRSHKETQFSRGGGLTARPKPSAALMARCAHHIKNLCTPSPAPTSRII